MNPIKRKIIIDLTSQELNIPSNIVDEIISFYYLMVQKKLANVEHAAINIPKLGTFVVKRKSLLEKIERDQFFVNKLEKDEDISVRMYEAIINKRAEIKQLTLIQNNMQEEYERKQEVKIKKQIYRDGKLN